MRQSDSIAKLAAALVKAQAQVENALKNATNPHFKSDYANLESVLDVAKPALSANGLALLQVPGFENGHATLESRLVHESGEWIEGTSGTPLQKGDPQGIGSATSYLRRYATAAIMCITQEDDDGQGMRGKAVEYVSEFQVKDLRERIKNTGADETKFLIYMKASEVARIPADKYDDAVRALEAKAQDNGKAKKAAAR